MLVYFCFFFTLSLRLWWIFTLMEHLGLNQLHFKCSVGILDSARLDLGLNEHFGAHEKLFGQKSSSAQSRICGRSRGRGRVRVLASFSSSDIVSSS